MSIQIVRALFAWYLWVLRLGVEQHAFVFLVVVDDVAGENLERLAAALIEELIARLVEALRDLVGAGFLFVDNLGDNAGAACIDRPTDFAGSQVKELGSDLADLAELRHLAGFADQVAGFDRRAHCLGGLGKIVGGVRLVGQFVVF